MATEGDKQSKEATKPSGNARPAAGRAKTASRAGAKPARRSTGGSNRPAGRAASKPADKAGAAKTAAKPAASKPAKGGAAKPASRTARGATATAKAERGAKPAAKATKSEEAVGDGTGAGVNREMKRMMKKREGAADRLRRPPTVAARKRTKPLTFLKEVRGELGRVAWPTRPEVMTYSVVVLVTVIFFMVVIAGIDYVALKGVLFLIERGGR
jgi:preprotein translocase SecE subunit